MGDLVRVIVAERLDHLGIHGGSALRDDYGSQVTG
ncbi:hypothetical protein SMF913_27744 [Streptomyces malaysiensis]|uniref:Uncharacterized protein n=1 Tax=Streptomyces malaysiensis TaxID=92644 RepID=A0A2J7YWJ6_STRMQ|nr:hypothetical protein SMF913_27744 [Streptomyces malaysiensis]